MPPSNRGDQLLNPYWSHRTMMFPFCCLCTNNLQVGDCEERSVNWLNYRNSVTHLFCLFHLYLRKSSGNILICDVRVVSRITRESWKPIHSMTIHSFFFFFWLVKLANVLFPSVKIALKYIKVNLETERAHSMKIKTNWSSLVFCSFLFLYAIILINYSIYMYMQNDRFFYPLS